MKRAGRKKAETFFLPEVYLKGHTPPKLPPLIQVCMHQKVLPEIKIKPYFNKVRTQKNMRQGARFCQISDILNPLCTTKMEV